MDEIKKVNEQLEYMYPELMPINEMAELDGGIVVRNDNDDSKFSHFHWHGVHFNLFEIIPENVSELKRRIHFSKEQEKLSGKELGDLLEILYSKSTKKAGKFFNTVHDFVVAQWELLNKRDVDEKY